VRLIVVGGLSPLGARFIRHWIDKYTSDEILNVDYGDHEAETPGLVGIDELRYFSSPSDIRIGGDIQSMLRWIPDVVVIFVDKVKANLLLDMVVGLPDKKKIHIHCVSEGETPLMIEAAIKHEIDCTTEDVVWS